MSLDNIKIPEKWPPDIEFLSDKIRNIEKELNELQDWIRVFCKENDDRKREEFKEEWKKNGGIRATYDFFMKYWDKKTRRMDDVLRCLEDQSNALRKMAIIIDEMDEE